MDELGPMFGIYSSGPCLPWLWIMEYLSSFPQIDTSIIRGLIQTAPVLPEDLGENTSERVALKCLEEIFGPKNGLENVAPPESRVAFDLSSSCDDVLEHILQEVSLSNLKKAGPELLRWDAQPFIMHKRTSLPICALEQLKGSILEQIPVLDGEENEPTSRSDNSDDENGNQEGNLIPQITKSDNEVLQDGLLESNSLPATSGRNDSVAGNLVGLVSVNQDGMQNDLRLNAKRFKQDSNCTIQCVEQDPIRLHGKGQVEVTEKEGKNFGKDSQAVEGAQDFHVASRTLEPSNAAVSHVELQENQRENVQNADTDAMAEQKYGDRECQNTVMDDSNYADADPIHLHGEAQVEVTEKEGNNFGKVSQAGEGGQDVHVASRTLEWSNAVSHVELQENQMENVQNADADAMFEQKFGDRECQNVVMDPICLHGDGQVEITEKEGNNIGKDSQAGEGDQDVHVATRTLEQSNAVSLVELRENQMENVQNADADADAMVEQKNEDRECQNIVVDESNYVENGALQKGPSGDACENIDQVFPLSSPMQQNIDPAQAKADMEHPCAEQICEKEDERLNIALEKNLFLSSQSRASQDTVGKVGWTEQNLCIKCQQDGQMLVCSSSDCRLVVHESCLNSAARFDDKDNFYCPFCAYSHSISEYLKAKDKTFLAREDLAAFMKLFTKNKN